LIKHLTEFIGRDTDLSDFPTVHIIDKVSNTVSWLIYLPFSMLFVLIVSRNRLFNAWDWSPIVIVFFASGLTLLVFVSLLLQRSACKAKDAAIEALNRDQLKLLDPDQPLPEPKAATGDFPDNLNEDRKLENARLRGNAEAARERRVAQGDELRKQIEAFDGVAFQSWYDNPILRAILIPVGGIGSLQLLEKLSGALH
jgi:hypothetical protein